MGPGYLRGPGMMSPAMARPVMMQSAASSSQVEAKPVEKTAEPVDESADLEQAKQMVEMLRSSGNPKFANSKFVSFIDKVSKGDLKFQENTVVDRAGNHVDWDSLYDVEGDAGAEGRA